MSEAGGGGPVEQPHGEEKPASLGQVKALIRRRLRKHEEHMEMGLNIYPMMDMMTILLVFLIMQFAAASADTVPSEELQIPYSISTTDVESAIAIQVARNEISVDGDHCLNLRNGIIDPSQKQGGGTGFLVTPLLNVMTQHRTRQRMIAERNPNRPFRGEVRIIADRRTPFRTLAEVVYTLGQAEYKNIRFVLLKQEGR